MPKQGKPKETQTKGHAKHDPSKTEANRARRIKAEQQRQAEAAKRREERVLVHARTLRRAQEQMHDEQVLENVYQHGKAAEIAHLINRKH